MPESITLSITDSRSNTDIVSLEEVKNYLRVTNNQDDVEIQDAIDNSIDAIERYLSQDILAKERRMFLDTANEDFQLYYAPLSSVAEITVDGTALTSSDYTLKGIEDPAISLENYPAESVNVRYFTKGITDISKLKQGIKSRVAMLYFGRDSKVMTNWKAYLAPYKRYAFFGTR